VTGRVLNIFAVIFGEIKISRKHLPKIEVLTEVLRAILLGIDTEVTKYNDPYLCKELVNTEHIQDNQEALRSSPEYSSGSIYGLD
jgi:hypothetical protein